MARSLSCSLLLTLAVAILQAQPQRPSEPDPTVEPPRFRYMGPASAGRIAAVAGIPGDTSTYYAGAASGGIWKTTDSGKTFEPIFDAQNVQAIGALAIAASDPTTIWAGTGEAWVIRPSDVMGDGVYKSTDAGKTWKNVGLAETGRIGRVVIHPTNPDIVYVCALGRATGPQQERGVYKTADAGATWRRVLFVNPDTGCSGLSMDAKNPDVLVAGTWQVVMQTWAMFSGGPGSGVYKSIDAGETWKRIEHPGLFKPPVGKIDVAIAPTNSNRVYALAQTPNQGSLWRSDDGGTSWKVVSWDRTLIGRAGYYIRLAISTKDENEVFVMSSSPHRSNDGGLTFVDYRGGCGDCHDMWVDPTNADHWVSTGDGGMGITTNHGQSFTSIVLPIGQMYHVAADNRTPYWIYSNRQDDGTMRGRSDSPVPVTNVPSYAPRRPAGFGGAGFG
ncbi:MAG: WD40/YVTN/BNR-like repeat-containing protein, partial [Vicinamibacterales bacterium]